MIVSCWNIRGFNNPLKHKRVLAHLKKNKVDIMGILETKLKRQDSKDIVKHKFRNWASLDNFHKHQAGRILILWNPNKIRINPVESTAQAIHCHASCLTTGSNFYISFIYGFNTVVGRRPLWDNLKDFSSNLDSSWITLGDFNNVLNLEERVNGTAVTSYQTSDFSNCFISSGLTDINFSGSFFYLDK